VWAQFLGYFNVYVGAIGQSMRNYIQFVCPDPYLIYHLWVFCEIYWFSRFFWWIGLTANCGWWRWRRVRIPRLKCSVQVSHSWHEPGSSELHTYILAPMNYWQILPVQNMNAKYIHVCVDLTISRKRWSDGCIRNVLYARCSWQWQVVQRLHSEHMLWYAPQCHVTILTIS